MEMDKGMAPRVTSWHSVLVCVFGVPVIAPPVH